METKITDTRIMAITAGVVVVVVLLLAAIFGMHVAKDRRTTTISVNSATITATVADTQAAREQGLSDTDSLAPNHGMLFIFPQPGADSIWMKNMHYPIDVLWLDGDKKVVHIVEHMKPESYPEAYQSPSPASYVLEVSAGFVKANHVSEGTALLF